MTTIAINKENGKVVISADSRAVGAFISQTNVKKLYNVVLPSGEKAIASGAGSFAGILEFVSWIEGGMDPDDYPGEFEESTDFVLITKQGVFSYEKTPIPLSGGFPYAEGSGAGYAMGAMLHGASTKEAVKIAAKLDPFTGGKIVTVTLE